jgi:hypothetical protein
MKYWLKMQSSDASPGLMHADLMSARALMAEKSIHVLEAGLGIGGAYWLVVSDPSKSIAELRGKLGQFNVFVEHVEPVQHPSEGYTLGRQVPLFH